MKAALNSINPAVSNVFEFTHRYPDVMATKCKNHLNVYKESNFSCLIDSLLPSKVVLKLCFHS